MPQAQLRFYAELNDFLPPARQQVTFAHSFQGRVSVKDMIESLGVPHTEVDLILVNGGSVDFAYLVQDGDQISVYPMFELLDVTPVIRLRPQPLRDPRFVLDAHLGKLATYLRLLGFDALYENDYADQALARLSAEQRRILLTKDRGLLKRSVVTHGYFVRATAPRSQVREVLERFDLRRRIAPFSRCLRCNGPLAPVAAGMVADRLPPDVRAAHPTVYRCTACDRVYWPGTHYTAMARLVADLLGTTPD